MGADESISPVRPNSGEAGNRRRFYESLSQKPVLTMTGRGLIEFPRPLNQALEKDRSCFVNETSGLIMKNKWRRFSGRDGPLAKT